MRFIDKQLCQHKHSRLGFAFAINYFCTHDFVMLCIIPVLVGKVLQLHKALRLKQSSMRLQRKANSAI